MTRTEHLLTILAEECNETAQRCSKALRFSLTEVQPDQVDFLTNAERIVEEFLDLMAVFEMLEKEGIVPEVKELHYNTHIEAKKAKVELFLLHSKENVTLQ